MELTEVPDSFHLPDGIDIIGPVACMDCGFEGEIPQKWFHIDPPLSRKGSRRKAMDLLKTQEGYESFDNNVWQGGTLVSVSWCPKCGSESTVDDY
jgi:hypothetical protein